jgi:hypothetical protein
MCGSEYWSNTSSLSKGRSFLNFNDKIIHKAQYLRFMNNKEAVKKGESFFARKKKTFKKKILDKSNIQCRKCKKKTILRMSVNH